MLKELIEDVKRYQADREVNSRLVECYDVGTSKLVQKAWRHVKVCLTICPAVNQKAGHGRSRGLSCLVEPV